MAWILYGKLTFIRELWKVCSEQLHVFSLLNYFGGILRMMYKNVNI